MCSIQDAFPNMTEPLRGRDLNTKTNSNVCFDRNNSNTPYVIDLNTSPPFDNKASSSTNMNSVNTSHSNLQSNNPSDTQVNNSTNIQTNNSNKKEENFNNIERLNKLENDMLVLKKEFTKLRKKVNNRNVHDLILFVIILTFVVLIIETIINKK